jgi:hypothetical protein
MVILSPIISLASAPSNLNPFIVIIVIEVNTILIKRHRWVTRAKMLLVLRENVAIVISTEHHRVRYMLYAKPLTLFLFYTPIHICSFTYICNLVTVSIIEEINYN